jgi:hypothetical protein
MVTLEDVIEEIIQGEIRDETDAGPSVFPRGASETYHGSGYDYALVHRTTTGTGSVSQRATIIPLLPQNRDGPKTNYDDNNDDNYDDKRSAKSAPAVSITMKMPPPVPSLYVQSVGTVKTTVKGTQTQSPPMSDAITKEMFTLKSSNWHNNFKERMHTKTKPPS